MNAFSLPQTVDLMLSPGKGLLAADESFPSIEKRFKPLGIASTEDNRRAYREMLFTTPGLADFISGVILFDETLHQKAASGVAFADGLAMQGIVPGIKVDLGAVALPGFPREKFTQGLDGLRERLADYYQLGARFAKWRAVISIDDGLPTKTCIGVNARMLALFAALSQEAGLVPVVEPEVLMEGAHPLSRCEEVITRTLQTVFEELEAHRVVLEHMILKSGMVLPGDGCDQQASDADIAEATVRCFRRSVPPAVPGIVFLSGGQSEQEATQRLDAIASTRDLPWRITFSYGRALQDSALKAWHGSAANVSHGQDLLLHRARCNSQAALGTYTASMEEQP